MSASIIAAGLIALGASNPPPAETQPDAPASRPANRPDEWGELFRWLRVGAVMPTTQPTAGGPLRICLWAEAVGQTARLLPDDVSAFCLLKAGRERYFSVKLRAGEPVALESGAPRALLAADLSAKHFFVYDGKLKLVDGYPTPGEGQPPPKLAGPARDLLKIGRYAMQCFVYVAPADGWPAALAKTPVLRFEVVPAEAVKLTDAQREVYDRLAPKFRRGVVSASKAAPEAVAVGPPAVPTLEILLGPAEPGYARAWASDAVCKILHPSATALIRKMIRRPELGDRNVLAYRLMNRRDADAAQLIVELLEARKGPVPRLWIARGFVDFRRKFEGPSARLLLTATDPMVLYLCGMALRRGRYKQSDTQRLVDVRDTESIRQQAAVVLIDGLDQADEDLRPDVFKALASLTGLRHTTVEAWQTWKKRHADVSQ